jgi:hypothetical protein
MRRWLNRSDGRLRSHVGFRFGRFDRFCRFNLGTISQERVGVGSPLSEQLGAVQGTMKQSVEGNLVSPETFGVVGAARFFGLAANRLVDPC